MSNRKTVADLSPLGLWGFSAITLSSAIVNCHWLKEARGLFPAMFFVGGAMQVLAGIADVIRYETFGANVFPAFGFYWITEGFWFLMMFIATLRVSMVHQATLAAVCLVLFTAAMELLVDKHGERWQQASGYFQLLAGILAFYISLAVLCREMGVCNLPMGWVDPVDKLDKQPARRSSMDLEVQELALPGDAVVVANVS